jgi:subtilisin-like proprotein convertase family protein
MKTSTLSLLAAALPLSGAAQVFEFPVGQAIPDGSSAGLVNIRQITAPALPILDLNVRLEISGLDGSAYNGDLFITLQHDSGYVVLLNRVGQDTVRPFGYGDNGLQVLLDDEAADGDIHTYRSVTGPLRGAALEGIWAPDGRTEDPATVSSSSSRATSLASFDGLDPSGTWILFVADLELGAPMRLDSWALEITAVPEPAAAAAATALLLAGLAVWRRKAGQSSRP